MNAAETQLRAGRVVRQPVAIVADLVSGTETLLQELRFWHAILPRTARISTAQASVAGLERALLELRSAMREHDPQPAA